LKRRRIPVFAAIGVLGAVLLLLASQPGIARADVLGAPARRPSTSVSATTAQTSPSPSATGTSAASTTDTVSPPESAGGTTAGAVVLICILAVLAIGIGIFFIRRARVKRRASGPGSGR
jgi:hypothetical protein